jgi:hypothetical protein
MRGRGVGRRVFSACVCPSARVCACVCARRCTASNAQHTHARAQRARRGRCTRTRMQRTPRAFLRSIRENTSVPSVVRSTTITTDSTMLCHSRCCRPSRATRAWYAPSAAASASEAAATRAEKPTVAAALLVCCSAAPDSEPGAYTRLLLRRTPRPTATAARRMARNASRASQVGDAACVVRLRSRRAHRARAQRRGATRGRGAPGVTAARRARRMRRAPRTRRGACARALTAAQRRTLQQPCAPRRARSCAGARAPPRRGSRGARVAVVAPRVGAQRRTPTRRRRQRKRGESRARDK